MNDFLNRYKHLGQFSFSFHRNKTKPTSFVSTIRLEDDSSKYQWSGSGLDKDSALEVAIARAEEDLFKLANQGS